MKVLDLQCAQHHSFEGWFGSEGDFAEQQTRGLVTCPLCGDASIQKMLSAPRLNLRAARNSAAPGAAAPDAPSPSAAKPVAEVAPSGGNHRPPEAELQGRILRAMREVLAKTEDVGDRFADEARAMHHGDAAPRSIRGQATPDVAMELAEEGIDVMPLPLLQAVKETLQ